MSGHRADTPRSSNPTFILKVSSRDTDDSVAELRRELLARLDARPFLAWPPQLLRALVAVFDAAGICHVPPAAAGNQPPTRLHLVK